MAAHIGTHPEDCSGWVLKGMIPPLILLIFVVVSAGCLETGQSPTGATENRIAGAVSSGYVLQNTVVNSSASPSSKNASEGNLLEDRTATAIHDAMDSRNPITRDFAVTLIPPAHGGMFRTSQLCDLWDAAESRWTYVEDPQGGDYFSPASRTIVIGLKGDCDDFAILVAALIESVGGNSRIVSVRNGTAGHAYPEVFIGTTPEEFERAAAYIRGRYPITDIGCHITRDANGTRYWLNLDWGSRYPGGQFFVDDGMRTAYYPDGRWEQVTS